jgi:hypothetical protein
MSNLHLDLSYYPPPPTDKDGSITLDLIKFMKLYLIVASHHNTLNHQG